MKLMVTPTPVPQPTKVGAALTYESAIGPLLNSKCAACHGEGGAKGVVLTSYQKVMASVTAGKPADSLLLKVQTGANPHFGQLSPDESELVTKWITNGSPEK